MKIWRAEWRIDLDKSLHVDLEADMCKYTGYYIKSHFFCYIKQKQNESVKRVPQKADQIIVYY